MAGRWVSAPMITMQAISRPMKGTPSVRRVSLAFNLSDAAQQWRNGQPLRKNGKGHHGKGKGNDGITLRYFRGHREREGQRQRTAQTSPKEHVLVLPLDLEAAEEKYRTDGVDRNSAPQRHQCYGDNDRQPYPTEVLLCDLGANQ